MTINVTKASIPDFDEYCSEIRELWDSHWLTNTGAKYKQLQQELEKYLSAPHATLDTDGHLTECDSRKCRFIRCKLSCSI